MITIIALPAILYFMYILYTSAIKQYKEDYNYFYRVADSERISENTKDNTLYENMLYKKCINARGWRFWILESGLWNLKSGF